MIIYVVYVIVVGWYNPSSAQPPRRETGYRPITTVRIAPSLWGHFVVGFCKAIELHYISSIVVQHIVMPVTLPRYL